MAEENLNLKEILLKSRNLSLAQKTAYFAKFISKLNELKQNPSFRIIDSPTSNRVTVIDSVTREKREMLMFGSNNYLGLADHPYLLEKISDASKKYGVGLGGPPTLNGYTSLHKMLEERISDFKKKEDTLLFSSGYAANVGLLNGITDKNDRWIYDSYSHASFYDGLKSIKSKNIAFKHNDTRALASILSAENSYTNTFIGVEGVYSMDGNTAPLDKIAPIARKHNAILVLDDAHGTGIMGPTGRGTAEHYTVEKDIDIILGTFSKAFALNGAFISSDKPTINYLRYFARSYMFSASLPPVSIAAIGAIMDIIESEPERRQQLHENVARVTQALKDVVTLASLPEAAIIAIRVPSHINIRQLAMEFHQNGIFISSIEYPAVSVHEQRIRISMTATHTKEDIAYLVDFIRYTWEKYQIRKQPVKL